MVAFNEANHYATNVGAVLAQIATGGGASHLEEQLSCIAVPSLSKKSFIQLERTLGTLFEKMVSKQLLRICRTTGEIVGCVEWLVS